MLSQLKAKIIQARKRGLAKRDWKVRYAKVFSCNPYLAAPVSAALEHEHKQLWSPLRKDMNIDTLRVCVNLSGSHLPDFVPEEVFVSEVEPCLNSYSAAVFLENKSVYNRWFPAGVLPACHLHDIDGQFFSRDYQLLNARESDLVLSELRYPVVLKPSIDSGGGRGVSFPKTADELRAGMRGRFNFVVQEQIRQHEFFSNLNRGRGLGVNTLRVCVYRSVKDNEFHILNMALRTGNTGTLDNDAAGGIACSVALDGSVNSYGVDKFGTKYLKHPASGVGYAEIGRIPLIEGLKTFVHQLAAYVWLARLMSFDICMDEAGDWRLIEVNLFGQTIRFSQYAGHAFFGEFTQEVIDFCLLNKAR